MGKEYSRWQIKSIKNALQNRRVVVISGARQTGKTTIARQVADKNSVFRTLDDESVLALAKHDPREFVRNHSGTMIIDEIQKAPELISEIKIAVDKDNRKGQYLLTGSANMQTLRKISDSLAGRISHIRLRPLATGEILGKKPAFFERLFAKDFPMQIKGYDKEAIFNLAFRGGYPEAVQITNEKERKSWHLDYIESLLRKDLREIENLKRQDALLDLVKILAGWSSKYMDNAKIGSQMNIAKPTLETYINALEQMFIYEKVRPWIRTDYEYVGKKPKFFSTDTGLMCSILNWSKPDILLDPDRAGKLMETFVFQELAVQLGLSRNYSLYQYRDYKKHEVDFLVKKEGDRLVGIEVKSSSKISKSDFTPQIWFKENILKGKTPYNGIVLYSGEHTLPFGDGLFAVPIAALWAE